MPTQGKEHKRQSIGQLVNSWSPGEEAEVEVDRLAFQAPAYVAQASITVNELHLGTLREKYFLLQAYVSPTLSPRLARP
jgi:hypothetical protein